MACITRQRVGKYTYLYESTSYRDENGKPRNKKVRIGKLDLVSGKPIFDDPTYEIDHSSILQKAFAECNASESSADDKKETKIDQIPLVESEIESILDSTKNYGSFYVFKFIAEEIGLLQILKKIFPEFYKEIFILTCFLIETQEPLMYCKEWLSETKTYSNIHELNSQFISILFSKIKDSNRNNFFEEWIEKIVDNEYVALDITSISSYSQLMDSCEWGYNRDKEDLPQINVCMLFGEGCKFPIFFKDYPGSLSDVTTLKNTLTEIKNIAPNSKIRVAMDKGFYSKDNVNGMINEGIDFLISIPFRDSFAKRQIDSENKDIDSLSNTILTSEGAIRGVHKIRSWKHKNVKTDLHVHVYYNPIKAVKEKNELYAYITELRYEALKNSENKDLKDEFDKYLIIRKSSKNDDGCTINVREDIVDKKLKTCGWMILISNYIDDAQNAIDIYRRKDVVEKCFDRLKNSMDFMRLRVHSDEKMRGKLFVAFVSIIIISIIHKKMEERKLYKKYTMHEMILKLRRIKITTIRQKSFLQPITKEQREILEALSVPQPTADILNAEDVRVDQSSD